MAALNYGSAVRALEGVIRYTRPESKAGQTALAMLPEALYRAALNAYGKGRKAECRDSLKSLVEKFAYSPWAEKARVSLHRIDNPPPGMVYVPEGEFYMGTSRDELRRLLKPFYPKDVLQDEDEFELVLRLHGYSGELPRHKASTGAFYIDVTEVTNADYKKFVDETGHPAPPGWQGGKFPEGEDKKPVTQVSRDDAAAYAEWAGKRLPTEAEWEKAARGADSRIYPWGDIFDRKAVNHMRPRNAGTVEVGTFQGSASPYGVLDMIGNVWEWTASTYGPYPGNEQVTEAKALAVARGGAWYQPDLKPIPTRAASRMPLEPTKLSTDLGFRCVKDVQ